MEQTENKTEKGFWHSVKTVCHFLVLLTIKGFKKPKKSSVVPIKQPDDRKKGVVLLQLLRFSSRKIKNSLEKEYKETKELLPQKNKPKRQYKTWARVKQDFREYYQDMIEEFEGEQTNALPKNTLGSETAEKIKKSTEPNF